LTTPLGGADIAARASGPYFGQTAHGLPQETLAAQQHAVVEDNRAAISVAASAGDARTRPRLHRISHRYRLFIWNDHVSSMAQTETEPSENCSHSSHAICSLTGGGGGGGH